MPAIVGRAYDPGRVEARADPMTLRRRVLLAASAVAGLALTTFTTAAAAAPAPPVSVSRASGIITVKDGLTPSGTSVKPFKVRLTVTGLSFPTHEVANRALSGNVFVHITVRVTNLAGAARVISFNGSEIRTMAMGVSHNVPAMGVDDSVCSPPSLDGLRTDQQVSNQVTAQWCVVGTSTEQVTVGARKSKPVTFGDQVVSRADAQAGNFALIYSPSDVAQPTILPVGPGTVATTVPS
jgi:hypothetical protein